MQIKWVAIDDEPLALELLEDNIKKLPYLQLVAQCSNAFEAMKVLQEQAVDLIFLDVQMPGLTGLQFIQSMAQKPMIILITAYDKYALEGFNLDVVDYVVKPVSVERFIKACNKAWELFQLRTKQVATVDNVPEYLFVNVDYSLLKIVISDIIFIEGLKDYIKIHLSSTTRPVVTRMNMKTMEEQLPATKFIRIHKSYIISVRHIASVRKNSVFVNEHELPVGDNYKETLATITGKQN